VSRIQDPRRGAMRECPSYVPPATTSLSPSHRHTVTRPTVSVLTKICMVAWVGVGGLGWLVDCVKLERLLCQNTRSLLAPRQQKPAARTTRDHRRQKHAHSTRETTPHLLATRGPQHNRDACPWRGWVLALPGRSGFCITRFESARAPAGHRWESAMRCDDDECERASALSTRCLLHSTPPLTDPERHGNKMA
jgi:hypothetical protein